MPRCRSWHRTPPSRNDARAGGGEEHERRRSGALARAWESGGRAATALDATVRNPGIECESISWLAIQYRGDQVPLMRMKALSPAVALDPDAQLCELGFCISDTRAYRTCRRPRGLGSGQGVRVDGFSGGRWATVQVCPRGIARSGGTGGRTSERRLSRLARRERRDSGDPKGPSGDCYRIAPSPCASLQTGDCRGRSA